MNKWSNNSAIEESKKYYSRSEFKYKCNSAYRYLIKNGLIGICHWLKSPKKDNSSLVIDYIDKCKEKYKNSFDYSEIDVNNIDSVSKTKVSIRCTEHGIFYQSLYQHLHSVNPCPLCRNHLYMKKENNKNKTIIDDSIEEGIIYCYSDKENGKKYIGQTIREERRKKSHLRGLSVFDKILQKKSINNFTYEVLFRVKEKRSKISEILNVKEKYYIKLFNTLVPNGYNISEGGGSVLWMVGYKPTEETRQKLSTSHLGKKNPMKGKHYSKEVREAIHKKWCVTMKAKYNNGYIAQRKSISFYKKVDNKVELIGIFPNGKMIERQFGICNKQISYCINKKKQLDDKYLFIHTDKYSDSLIETILKSPSVITKHGEKQVITEDGRVMLLKDAVKMYGKHVAEVCNGKRKQTKGIAFKWKY